MTFKEKLKNGLKEKGYTQKEFSQLTGISPSMISGYVNGYETPTQERKKIICDLLGFDEDQEVNREQVSSEHENILTIQEASLLLGVSQEFLRQSLIQQRVDFGWAVHMGSKWKFCIPKHRFTEFTGIEV